MKAHSGAAGNQTMWEIALTVIKKMASNRAAPWPVSTPDPGHGHERAEDEVNPAPEGDIGDQGALAAHDDDVVVEDRSEAPQGIQGPNEEHQAPRECRPTGVALARCLAFHAFPFALSR